jgi:hypothetical protein
MSIPQNEGRGISRSAARLRVAVVVVMAAFALLLGALWIAPAGGPVQVQVHDSGMWADARWSATLVFVLVELALFQLVKMLTAVRDGELFSARVVRHFRQFAFWLMILAIFGVAGPLLGSALGGDRTNVALVLDLRHLITLGVTLLLFLLARLLERARQIEEENREFV